MHVNVTFRHLDSSEPLKDYAVEKTERFKKFLHEPIEVQWILSVEKIRHSAEATIVADGVKINAEGKTADMYSAIDTAVEKLEKQVTKHKEKLKRHKGRGNAASSVRYEGAAETASAGPRIAKKENLFLKPMSVEEAAMQMDTAKRDFLLFTDSTTGNVNVIYRTEDDGYGIIEAHAR